VKVSANECTVGGGNVLAIPRDPDSNTVSLHGTIDGSCQASITLHDPSLYSATVLAETLVRGGIQISGVGRDRTSRQRYAAATPQQRAKDWTVLCIFETPIRAVINRANKDSQNLYAEALCKRSGAASSGQSGSWANGTANTARFLQQLGVATSEFCLDDGCGLSRDNLISANAMVHVLMHNWVMPYRQEFLDSLSVGGVDGTLRKRFDNGLSGRVHAKTGFIANVSSLSGYLEGRDGNWYAFSILINGIPDLSNSSIKPLQDRIVKAIDDQAIPLEHARR
jgi:D-alanyl-D-alanine carboxypeptidase/D-alanyl-D-alanine-endopeptidase (penicillin-binding protein 4)